jgi:cytochrome c553
MARKLTAMIVAASIGITGAVQAAGSATAGKTKAFECGGCHGDMGQGMGSYPALAGKPEAALVKALQDFKTGTTPSLMHGLAASLIAQDIQDLAAY